MNTTLAYRIGLEDGILGNIALPFDGWYTVKESLAYLRGYYAGKDLSKDRVN